MNLKKKQGAMAADCFLALVELAVLAVFAVWLDKVVHLNTAVYSGMADLVWAAMVFADKVIELVDHLAGNLRAAGSL